MNTRRNPTRPLAIIVALFAAACGEQEVSPWDVAAALEGAAKGDVQMTGICAAINQPADCNPCESLHVFAEVDAQAGTTFAAQVQAAYCADGCNMGELRPGDARIVPQGYLAYSRICDHQRWRYTINTCAGTSSMLSLSPYCQTSMGVCEIYPGCAIADRCTCEGMGSGTIIP